MVELKRNFFGYVSVDWVRKARITRTRSQHGCTKKVNCPQKVLAGLRRLSIATFRLRPFDSDYPPSNLNRSYKGKAFVIRRCRRHGLRNTVHI